MALNLIVTRDDGRRVVLARPRAHGLRADAVSERELEVHPG
ncbi:MAG: hypothetical protein R3A48_11410 [Polyangiales bacterium]